MMKYLFLVLLSIATASLPAWGEPTTVHFRGILDLGSSRLFSLATDGGAQTAWVSEGEAFAGYEVVEYRAANNSLLLRRDGQDSEIFLATARAPATEAGEQPTRSTADEAAELLRSMKFEEMLASSLDQQREMMERFSRQMMQQMGQEIDEEAIALQMRILDLMNEEINWPRFQEEIAQLYGETFTSAELRGLIDFYSTPAGQAFVEKQPELSMGMMEILQPRIMQAMPKIQQLVQEAMIERQQRGTAQPD